MKVIIKKSDKLKSGLKLYKGVSNMELVRIYPRMRIKSNISEVKVKITPKKYKTPKSTPNYSMKVYFSSTLLNELGWTKESNIAISKDTKSIKNYVFQTIDDDKGFKISMNKGVNYLMFTIDNMMDKYAIPSVVEHEIISESLKIVL